MNFSFNRQLFLILLITLFLLTSCQHTSVPNPTLLAIHVLDVGQGDSVLITTPDNKTILIDGGEAEYGMKVVSYIKGLNIKKIDWLIATHPHSDHIGGLTDVINNFEVGELYMPPVVHTTKAFENLLLAIDKNQVKLIAGKGGHVIHINEDLSLRFLGPVRDYGDGLNDWSIINQIQYKEKSFIFMGDAEYAAEMDLINTYPSPYLRSHFIKIGHHGSNSSSSQALLDVLHPDIAVISVGKHNSYGHPHQETIDKIADNNIHLYRTDIQGSIVFYSDGERIWSPIPPIN